MQHAVACSVMAEAARCAGSSLGELSESCYLLGMPLALAPKGPEPLLHELMQQCDDDLGFNLVSVNSPKDEMSPLLRKREVVCI